MRMFIAAKFNLLQYYYNKRLEIKSQQTTAATCRKDICLPWRQVVKVLLFKLRTVRRLLLVFLTFSRFPSFRVKCEGMNLASICNIFTYCMYGMEMAFMYQY